MDNKQFAQLLIEQYPKSKRNENNFKFLLTISSLFLLTAIIVLVYNYRKTECHATIISNTTFISCTYSLEHENLDYVWPDNVKKLVNEIVDNNMHVTNDDRAVLIKTELMRFKTNDVFYIMVYNDVSGPSNQVFYGNESEYITVFKPGKCNVVIYRSHFWRGSTENALTTVTKEVEETCKQGIIEKSDYSDTLKELFKNFHDINFLGLIEKENDVSIRSANSFGRIWGPGYWHTIKVLDEKTKEETGKEFILIAGYK